MSVAVEILRSYIEPRRSTRRILGQANSEGRALALLVCGCVMLFCSQIPALVGNGVAVGNRPPLVAAASARGMGALIFAPLLFYAIAGLTGLAMRTVGIPVSWRDARVSLFWAVLAISPSALLAGMARGLVGEHIVFAAISWLIGALFLVFWVSGLVESADSGKEVVNVPD